MPSSEKEKQRIKRLKISGYTFRMLGTLISNGSSLAIRLNACYVKNLSFVRLKIAVGSTPSSLYISKPLHSGTPVLQILSFHLRISPASSRSTSNLPSTRCFSLLHPLAKPYGSAAVFKNFPGNSRNRPNTLPRRVEIAWETCETTGNGSAPFRCGITAYDLKTNATDYRRCCRDGQK